MSLGTDRAAFIAGFVAGEGSFVRAGQRPTFTFAIRVGAVDGQLMYEVREFLGCGTVHWYRRRKAYYDDEVVFQVRRLADLVSVIVPFMDDHLPLSYKRLQYQEWRHELLLYWEHRARRPRNCAVPGCTEPVRAKNRCRHHYYEMTGR